MNIYLIGSYANSTRQKHPGNVIIKKDVSLTSIKIINPATGWFEIVGVPCFDLGEVEIGKSEYKDKYYARVIHICNQTLLYRYPCPHKVFFLFYL